MFDLQVFKPAREERKMAFYLLENDGHNTPAFWRFRDRAQAEHHLCRGELEMEGADGTVMRPGYFEEEEAWVDGEGTIWEVFDEPSLYVHDKTEEA